MNIPVLGCPSCASSSSGTLRVELPCTDIWAVSLCHCRFSDKQTMFFPGQANQTYVVPTRVRGMVEPKKITGGASDGAWFSDGGTPAPVPDNFNIFSLKAKAGFVSNSYTYYFNRDFGQRPPLSPVFTSYFAIDYFKNLLITGGSCLVLEGNSVDGDEFQNYNGFPSCAAFPNNNSLYPHDAATYPNVCFLRPAQEAITVPYGQNQLYHGQWLQLDMDLTVTLPAP